RTSGQARISSRKLEMRSLPSKAPARLEPCTEAWRRRVRAVLRILFCAVLLPVTALAVGPRKPVLPQIDLPHSYYYRELYLPQLTSGPAAAAWSPDGQWLVYACPRMPCKACSGGSA